MFGKIIFTVYSYVCITMEGTRADTVPNVSIHMHTSSLMLAQPQIECY